MYIWDEESSTVTILECYAKPEKKKVVSSEINRLAKEYASDRELREAEKAGNATPSEGSP